MEPVDPDDLEWTEYEHGERTFRRKQLGAAAGGEDLGASLYEIPPGKRTWPAHYHTANEEAVYVLDGDVTLHLGTEGRTERLTAGDYVALPAREEATHELENESDEAVRVLVVSTMNDPEVIAYPGRDRYNVLAGSAPGGEKSERAISKVLDANAEVPYWDDD